MYKKLCAVISILMVLLCFASCTSKSDEATAVSGKHHAEISVSYNGGSGVIKVELDADEAPITVANFMKLAKEGFYDGLTFHRIQKGYFIQGGDPDANGTGGSKDTIQGEFQANGVDNSLTHERGTISMARSQDYNSASSQFFICQQRVTSLDGNYAAFGKVTEGMDIIDDICDKVPSSDCLPKEEQPVIEKITIVD